MTDRVLERIRAAYPSLEDPGPPDTTVSRLRSAYAGDTAPAPHRWRRRRFCRVGLFALGAAIVSGTAAAATGGWHPLLGSPDRGPRPHPARADVPADQLAALAILRRPQTDVDRGPLVRQALK